MLRYLLTTTAAVAAPALAEAQTTQAPPAIDLAAQIIVTGTRAPTPVDQVPTAVTVLDRAEIDRAGDFSVADLLARTPGISISRAGGHGTATSLRIRGAETDQTVVVVDGVKLNDPSTPGGGYNFANLLVGDASRIEVLRGSQSILWGSQAIGGVVNVVTPLPERALEGSFDIEAGSRETVSGRVAIGGRSGPLSWRIGGQAFSTEGISAIAPSAGGVERDGYSNRNVAGRAELRVADGITLDLRGYYSDARVELDGFAGDSPAYALTRDFVGYAGVNIDLADGRFRNRLGYGYTDTDREDYDPQRSRPLSFDAAGRNERFEYQGSFVVADGWTILAGAEHEQSRFRSVAPDASPATPIPAPTRGEASLTSVYGQLSLQPLAGLTIVGGVRYDDHERYGGQTLFAGGATWALSSGTILRAAYSEGFKAPSLYQLFSEYGNVELDPEEADGWEAGIEQRLFGDRLTLSALYFERATTNQIIFNSCAFPTSPDPLCVIPGTSDPRFGYYANLAEAEAHGVEALASFRSGRFSADANYSWTVAEDRTPGATFGNWLPRRPRHAANASVSYALPIGLNLGAAIRYSGETFDDAANATRLDDYVLVDLRAEIAISDSIRLVARAENLFDEDYTTVARFGTLGRSIYVGIRGRF